MEEKTRSLLAFTVREIVCDSGAHRVFWGVVGVFAYPDLELFVFYRTKIQIYYLCLSNLNLMKEIKLETKITVYSLNEVPDEEQPLVHAALKATEQSYAPLFKIPCRGGSVTG